MDFDAVVNARRSVRGFFRDRLVPEPLLREALELAQRAPSNCNVQPWRVFIASGARRDLLSAELTKAALERGGAEQVTEKFSGDYRTLQIACAVELYSKMGVVREDLAGRKAAFLRNYAFFDAPHVAFICMDRAFGVGVALDVGTYLQTLMLALCSRGIQCCAQAALCRYEDVTQRVLGIDPSLRVLCGLSFGYEDPHVAANQSRQARLPIDKNVTLLA